MDYVSEMNEKKELNFKCFFSGDYNDIEEKDYLMFKVEGMTSMFYRKLKFSSRNFDERKVEIIDFFEESFEASFEELRNNRIFSWVEEKKLNIFSRKIKYKEELIPVECFDLSHFESIGKIVNDKYQDFLYIQSDRDEFYDFLKTINNNNKIRFSMREHYERFEDNLFLANEYKKNYFDKISKKINDKLGFEYIKNIKTESIHRYKSIDNLFYSILDVEVIIDNDVDFSQIDLMFY